MDLSKITDEQVALYMQENSGSGIEQIIDRYQAKLNRYIIGILKDEEKSEDVVQETFISVYKKINSFDSKRKFSSWIYRIAHNKAINEIRKTKPFISLDEVFSLKDEKQDVAVIEKSLDSKKARAIIKDKIELLPVRYKEVIYLRYFEDKTYEEISDIVMIPKNTVGVRIKRGLEKIKSNLGINPEDYL